MTYYDTSEILVPSNIREDKGQPLPQTVTSKIGKAFCTSWTKKETDLDLYR